jgi:hypothetical protein
VLDDRYQLVLAVALLAGEVYEFSGAVDDLPLFGGSRYSDAQAASELEQALITQHPERAQHGVRVDAHNGRKIASGREAIPPLGFAVGNRAANLRGDLIMQEGWFLSIDLDFDHGAIHSSFMASPVVLPVLWR